MGGKIIQETARKIKSLEAQGSAAVRKAVVQALRKSAAQSKAKTAVAFRREMQRNAVTLLKARPTEPEARTAVRIILKAASLDTPNLQQLRDNVLAAVRRYEKDRKEAMQRIALYGSRIVKPGSTILTHCHSHTVEEVLKKARRKIKMVYCTEARPLFQGRIMAENLAKAGVPATLIVDGAADYFMHDVDLLFTGCDAVLSDGSIVNKVGTNQIAMSAKKHHNPYYVFTSSHCFDPVTCYGFAEPIEERDWREVWGQKPKKVQIRNPAFDLVDSFYIHAIVTELGVFPPKALALEIYEQLGMWQRQQPFLGLLDSLKEKKQGTA